MKKFIITFIIFLAQTQFAASELESCKSANFWRDMNLTQNFDEKENLFSDCCVKYSDISIDMVDNLCRLYAEQYIDVEKNCLDKKVDGNETKVGIKEIHDICRYKAEKEADSKAKWYLKKMKIKKYISF